MTSPRVALGPAARPAGRSAETELTKAKLAKTKLTEIVVVCSKCAKRQGLRPRAVRALLKEAAKRGGRQTVEDGPRAGRMKLRIVESGCLGPCPKRAVAVATGASVAAGRVILLDPAAGPEEALAAVLHPVLPLRAVPEFGPNTPLAAVSTDESQPDS